MDLGHPDSVVSWRRVVFTTLLRVWLRQGEKRTLTMLADELAAEGSRLSVQKLSRFVQRHGSASDPPPGWARQPPEWLIFNLLRRTGRRLELTPTGVHIIDPAATRAGEGGGDADRGGADTQ